MNGDECDEGRESEDALWWMMVMFTGICTLVCQSRRHVRDICCFASAKVECSFVHLLTEMNSRACVWATSPRQNIDYSP